MKENSCRGLLTLEAEGAAMQDAQTTAQEIKQGPSSSLKGITSTHQKPHPKACNSNLLVEQDATAMEAESGTECLVTCLGGRGSSINMSAH